MSAYSALILSEPGLANYWRLGEAAGNALDSKGSAPAVPAGGLTRAVASLVGGDPADGATRFNGSTAKLAGPGVTLPIPGLWSIEMWLRTTIGAQRPAFSTRGSNGTVYIGTCNAPAGAFFCYWHGAGGAAQNNTGIKVISDGKPHHCVVTWDGTSIRLYVDGALDKTDAGTVPPGPAASPGTNFGWDLNNINEWWPGDVDEVAVYSGVTLSAAQVQAHYQTGIAIVRPPGGRIFVPTSGLTKMQATSAAGDYRRAVLAHAPLSYWRLNDVGATAIDQMGLANGTFNGAVVKGVPGATADGDRAYSQAAVSGQKIQLPSVLAFPGTAAFSLEAWLYPTLSDAAFRRIFEDKDATGGWTLFTHLAGAVFGVGFERYSQVNANIGGLYSWSYAPGLAGLPLNVWTHVVVTYDGAVATMYWNGVLIGSTNSAGAQGTPTTNAVIGNDTGGNTNPFVGSLDEVAIYPTALTQAQVREHFLAAQRIAPSGQRVQGPRQAVTFKAT